jgi:CxxH/CxxC protein (TIGR04129 family)
LGLGSQQWYACEEHVDILIDEVVDKEELAPSLYPYEKSDTTRDRCNWCGKRPAYVLRVETEKES